MVLLFMGVYISFPWKITTQAEAYNARKKKHKHLKKSIKLYKNIKKQLWPRQQAEIQALSFLLLVLYESKHVIQAWCAWFPISKTNPTGTKILEVDMERLFWNWFPFPLVSMENWHLPLLMVLISVRQASSRKNTRKCRQLPFYCIQKAETMR